jgi:hypothetical protein
MLARLFTRQPKPRPFIMQDSIAHFTVRRDNAAQFRWSTSPLPPIDEGEVLLAIDSFSFTANNVTYAMFGEKMKYWEFFPTDDAAYGTIPVWGFADVVASNVQGVAVGERFYGYYPMSTHLVVKASRVPASALRHEFFARRLSCRQCILRREASVAIERVEQDGVWNC